MTFLSGKSSRRFFYAVLSVLFVAIALLLAPALPEEACSWENGDNNNDNDNNDETHLSKHWLSSLSRIQNVRGGGGALFFFRRRRHEPPQTYVDEKGIIIVEGGHRRRKRRRRRSSLLRVDPSKVLSVMANKGGFFLPKSMLKELRILGKICNCDESSLDVLHRELEVLNFTVGMPGRRRWGVLGGGFKDHALRIGRLYVKWDSHKPPCVELQVDDVEVLVEFTNLQLTKNNWKELEEAGFPPKLTAPETEKKPAKTPPKMEKTETGENESEGVRFGSVDLLGHVIVHVHSRPLDRPIIPDFIFDLQTLDEINEVIKQKAREKTGRKGCTSAEVSDIIKHYFVTKLKSLFKSTALDLARSRLDQKRKSVTLEGTKRAIEKTREVLIEYVEGVQEKTEERIQKYLSERLRILGLEDSSETPS